MLISLGVEGFRNFKKLKWELGDSSHIFLYGRNGCGKTSIGYLLYILKGLGIGRGVDKLVDEYDFSETDEPIRLFYSVKVGGIIYCYRVVFNFIGGKVKIGGESLIRGEEIIFLRSGEKVRKDYVEFSVSVNESAIEREEEANNFREWVKGIEVIRDMRDLEEKYVDYVSRAIGGVRGEIKKELGRHSSSERIDKIMVMLKPGIVSDNNFTMIFWDNLFMEIDRGRRGIYVDILFKWMGDKRVIFTGEDIGYELWGECVVYELEAGNLKLKIK